MLVYKAAQVIAVSKMEPKEWNMGGRSGTTHSAKMAVVGAAADAVTITLKAKTAEELESKIKKYPSGKSAEVQILDVVPVFRSGDRRASSYEYTA